MRHYETLFIINPDLSEEDTASVVEKFSTILTDRGSNLVKVDQWGRRRLAYEVKKFNKG
ncbi:MAG: 30S ribosomal protein S6, partial [Desulfarculus sp.]|nr:30S ribosomal protein S6 [Desulfarculus sp.]